MSVQNKREFEVEKDGVKVTLAAIKPSQSIKQKADLEYAKAWGSYVKEPGMLLETALWDNLRKKNLWDDERQKKLEELDKKIGECEDMLPDEKGRVKKKGVTLSMARKAAIDMRVSRLLRINLLTEFTKFRSNTCEGLSENARFNYLVSQCVVNPDTKTPYFASLEDYLERASDQDGMKAAEEFASLYYGHDPDFDKNLPENKFLLKYKMCRDQDLALIDKDGNLVDVEGNKVDENGLPIDKPKEVEPETFDVEDDWNVVSTDKTEEVQ